MGAPGWMDSVRVALRAINAGLGSDRAIPDKWVASQASNLVAKAIGNAITVARATDLASVASGTRPDAKLRSG